MARSPSGKARVCKTLIGGSIPLRASKNSVPQPKSWANRQPSQTRSDDIFVGSDKGMTETNESSGNGGRKKAGWGLSLDGCSVSLALGLALQVWIGWIRHVPW
jgi:hypothetical protein